MGLFLVWCHRLICILLSLCKHARKEVCDVKQGIDLYPLLARSCDRWWPHFITFTACKKSRFGLKRGKKPQCVSNRCKDLFKRKKDFGVMCTLNGRLSLKRHSGFWTGAKIYLSKQIFWGYGLCKAVSWSVALSQVSYSLSTRYLILSSTQYLITEMLCIE